MLSHILLTVMCIQLLHVLHMHSLRFAPQCQHSITETAFSLHRVTLTKQMILISTESGLANIAQLVQHQQCRHGLE